MASLILDFVPPEIPGYDELQVWESTAKEDAPGTQIQTFPISGTYPTRMTVTTATSVTNWFSIRWAGPGPVFSEFSMPIQGGTSTLVGMIVNRVMLRQPNANENVVLQISEAVISEYFKRQDIYSIDPDTVSYGIIEGLTLYVMAQSLISQISSSSSSTTGSGWTAGLVSMKDSTGTETSLKVSWETVDRLLKQAEKWLGTSYSRIAQMNIEIAGGISQIVSADISRLLIEVE